MEQILTTNICDLLLNLHMHTNQTHLTATEVDSHYWWHESGTHSTTYTYQTDQHWHLQLQFKTGHLLSMVTHVHQGTQNFIKTNVIDV